MKRLLLSLFASSLSLFVMAQAPSMICYQGVAANASGAELVSTEISVRATFLKGTTFGAVVYSETHDVKTDQFGLFTLDLGSKGTAVNDLSKVEWGKGPYFLKIEMAIPKGSTFKDLGTTQLLSVPYALHAGRADTATVAKTAFNDKDIDPSNELQAFEFDKNTGKLKLVSASSPTGLAEITVQDADGDPKNEIQTLKFDTETGALSIVDEKGNKNSEVNTREGLFQQPGASPAYPQGIRGKYRFIKSGETYTVPAGKTFYVTANGNPEGVGMEIEVLGNKMEIKGYATCPVLPPTSRVTKTVLTGFEVDVDPKIAAVVIDLKSPYQIPPNKTLFIKSGIGVGNSTLIVDDELTHFYSVNSGSQVITIPGGPNGLTIKNPIGVPSILTGYLIDMP